MTARRRVFVRSVGAITPVGATWPASAEALAGGASAIRSVTSFDVSSFPCKVAAEVERRFEGEDRRLALARVAAAEAWQAGESRVAPHRLGVFIGAESGRAAMPTIRALAQAAGGGTVFDPVRFGTEARALAGEIDAAMVSPAAVASALAREIGAGGPVLTVSLACASGAAAIIDAVRAIRLGICDVALSGGVGADVDPLMLIGFGKLGALSECGASRPFDVRRDGFVVGEGAAMVVLTAAPTSVEVAGVGRTLDAHHLTKPHPEGDGAARAMRAALADAALAGVDYVQAHGTSTLAGDEVEAAAIRRVLPPNVPVGAVKGAVGHWVAGAGAIGFLCAVHAVQQGIALPTAGLDRPDPRCALDHVVARARQIEARAAMVNAFAFGGANASIVVRRAEG